MTAERRASPLVLARGLYTGFTRDGGVRLGAAVAYYSLFAFAPMLILAMAGAQRLLGTVQVAEDFRAVVEGVIGADLTDTLVAVLRSSVAGKYDTTISIVGLVLLLWAVGVAYSHLHASFNVMWHVRNRPGCSVVERMKIQAPRLLLALLPASMLIAVTLASSAMLWVAERSQFAVVDTLVATLGSPAVMALAAWASLSLLYLLVPDARVRTRDAVVPAMAVAVAWAFGTYLYGAYISSVGLQSASGAAGAVFLLLVWMNYTARAVLFGAWWGRWRAEKDGEIEPRPHAERVEGLVCA